MPKAPPADATPSKPKSREKRVSLDGPGNPFQEYGGSLNPGFNGTLLRNVLGTICLHGTASDEEKNRVRSAAAQAVLALKPKDEIEAMLAAQAVAMHLGSMECFRRAMIPDQHAEVAARMRKDGVNMARGMTDMLEALDRKRGKAPQVFRVERVVVESGGQAVVGPVQTGTTPKAGGVG